MTGHPVFAAVYDRLTRSAERKFLGAHRAWLCARATGRVLDLGAGTGANFPYLDADAQVLAAEPDPYMLARARRRARALGLSVTFLPDAAESLPLEAASVDAVLATLVLCTVEDPARALHEIRRILRPGGRLLFLEHVRLEHPVWGRVQDVVAPAWKALFAGCHPNRDTVTAVRRAGFTIEELERCAWGPLPGPLFVRGAAVPA
ncbi:MAG: class I SAM-dependent methyltransferase [Candidatus Rokubacteria bacterium]|nr:class I SAM-dependent methyltransferase [Candidatus Rokubacteria bacterium]